MTRLDRNTLGAIAQNFDTATYAISTTTITATVGGAAITETAMLQFITVVSNNNAHIVVLPAPTLGMILIMTVGAGHDYVLKTSSPATIAINGVSGATAKSDIGEGYTILLACTSLTEWKAVQFSGAAAGNVNGVTHYVP